MSAPTAMGCVNDDDGLLATLHKLNHDLDVALEDDALITDSYDALLRNGSDKDREAPINLEYMRELQNLINTFDDFLKKTFFKTYDFRQTVKTACRYIQKSRDLSIRYGFPENDFAYALIDRVGSYTFFCFIFSNIHIREYFERENIFGIKYLCFLWQKLSFREKLLVWFKVFSPLDKEKIVGGFSDRLHEMNKAYESIKHKYRIEGGRLVYNALSMNLRNEYMNKQTFWKRPTNLSIAEIRGLQKSNEEYDPHHDLWDIATSTATRNAMRCLNFSKIIGHDIVLRPSPDFYGWDIDMEIGCHEHIVDCIISFDSKRLEILKNCGSKQLKTLKRVFLLLDGIRNSHYVVLAKNIGRVLAENNSEHESRDVVDVKNIEIIFHHFKRRVMEMITLKSYDDDVEYKVEGELAESFKDLEKVK